MLRYSPIPNMLAFGEVPLRFDEQLMGSGRCQGIRPLGISVRNGPWRMLSFHGCDRIVFWAALEPLASLQNRVASRNLCCYNYMSRTGLPCLLSFAVRRGL